MSSIRQIALGSTQVRFPGDDETRIFGVIGHPVGHSLSPRFQQAALEAMGINAVYLAFDVAETELDSCFMQVRRVAMEGCLGGLNVTLPLKTTVIQKLDQIDEKARLAGAVNTITCRAGGSSVGSTLQLLGSNTDIVGMSRALSDCVVEVHNGVVVILGSGGAARAAVVTALERGAAEIRLLSRAVPQAQALLDGVSRFWTGRLPRLVCMSLTKACARALESADVLIQATSLGLREGDEAPISLQDAPQDLFVLDLIYNPAETALLRDARARGLRAENGLRMLVYQGAASLEQWLSREPPIGVMLASVGLGSNAP